MRIFLLGAGASAATLGSENAPVSADFGGVLSGKFPHWRDEFPFLSSAIDYLQAQGQIAPNWPLDMVWNGIDENYKLRNVIANNDFFWPSTLPTSKRLYMQFSDRTWNSFWILAGWELKRALTKVYGTSLQPFLQPSFLEGKWLSQQIAKLSEQDVIASMNYDLLAETISRQQWQHAWNCLTIEELCNRTDSKVPLILKLHGSLDWAFRSNRRTHKHRIDRTSDHNSIADNAIDIDLDFWETRPLVVSPVRYKDEIVFTNSQPDELTKVLNFQWKKFIEALSVADELHVLGYRFPSEDSYGNRMLLEAKRRRCQDRRLRILLYLPNEPPQYESQTVKDRLEKEIFGPSSVEIECCGGIRQ